MTSKSKEKPVGMADLLHCMICFVRPAGRNKFFISSCGHVFCEKCTDDDILLPWSTCKKCHNPEARLLEINSSLPPEVRDLFLPLEETLESFLKDLNRTLKFQENHRNRMMKHLAGKGDQVEKLQKYCKTEVKKQEAYRQEVAKLEEFKRKAVNEIRRLNHKNKAKKIPDPNTTILASNLQPPVSRRKPSFVTSTPLISNHSSTAMDDLQFDLDIRLPMCDGDDGDDDDNEINNMISATSNCRVTPREPPPLVRKYTLNPQACKKRAVRPEQFVEPQRFPSSAYRTPTTKKTRMDVGAFAQPFRLPKRL
ncbi:unnamed protein product [Auanema sp. JU1783]|nr:unnamed protein product [Auanema sp. JU1783]